MKTVEMKCRPFSSQSRATHRLSVASDGTVRVWDRVAGHYTRCHALSEASQRAARRLAASETT